MSCPLMYLYFDGPKRIRSSLLNCSHERTPCWILASPSSRMEVISTLDSFGPAVKDGRGGRLLRRRRWLMAGAGEMGQQQRCRRQMREERKAAQRACGCCGRKGGKDEGSG
ncbi:hypothetical protein BHE74_00023090 [Ensete ventricosum]|nr:hypothetical protein BHE74_00023090 [Ensete ventricosum]